MANARERIVILASDAATRESLQAALSGAGYEAAAFATVKEGLDAIREHGSDMVLFGPHLADLSAREALATIRGSATTETLRVVLLVGPSAEERATVLDLGGDDALSTPWEMGELLARVRAQFRVQRAETQLRDKMRIAEEGQQIAHTAFEALAVTEKMANEASSIGRNLKIGVGAALAVLAAMAAVYLLFVRSAQHQT